MGEFEVMFCCDAAIVIPEFVMLVRGYSATRDEYAAGWTSPKGALLKPEKFPAV